MKLIIGFITSLFAIIGTVIVFIASLAIPSFAIKFSVDRLAGTDLDVIGIFFGMFAIIMVKMVFFTKE